MTFFPRRPSAWPLLLIATPSALSGCDGCGQERPYTPFGVASSLPMALPAPSVDTVSRFPPDSGLREFHPQTAIRAPDRAREWRLGGYSLVAPDGLVFHSGLVADLDGDGGEDAAAWVESPKSDTPGDGGNRGALWYYSAQGEQRQLSNLPGFVPSGPGCTTEVRLQRTGPTTITLDTAGKCSTARLARSPARSIQVFAPRRPEPQLWGLRVAEPAADEDLSLSAVTVDRDADGLDDIDVTVTVSRFGSERPASMRWVWLDRAAGASRDDREPSASFARMASIEQVRSSGKNTSKGALVAVDNARRLYATVCAESGTERLWTWDGVGLRCGPLGVALDRLAHAELQASLQQSDVVRAFSVLERDGWYGERISKAERTKLEGLLRSAVKRRSAKATALSVRARRGSGTPQYSPVTFDATGTLLVQTESGQVGRIVGTALESPAQPAPPGFDGGLTGRESWPLNAVGPAGESWVGVIHACGRSEVAFLFSGTAAQSAAQVTADLPAARPGRCRGPTFHERRPPIPIAWTREGLTALVGGRVLELGPVAAATTPAPAGSPRSVDGTWLVIPTDLGLLLRGEGRWDLWELDTAAQSETLHHCVVAPEAARVACLGGASVWLIVPND